MADDGWVRIPAPTYRQRLLIGGVWYFVVIYVCANPLGTLGERIEERLGGGWITVTAALLVGIVVAAALVLLVVALITPALDVHACRGLIRVRGKERPSTDLVGALVELAVDTPPSRYDKPRKRPRRDPVTLRLDLDGGSRFRVVLAIGPTTTITPERAAALIAAVRGSRIEVPTASYDPDGRFTHLNFPGRLDIPDTIRLIEDPQCARAQLR
ncbi:hypothetical protein GW571_13220 [Clavibacter capsici]|uniref:hypothetical protein n=1 Tax=Clavibacter capsici TaxID=1874630 RepID=UPI001427F04D|nr:hypothetical protein [Clavibacter capsici]QIS43023.1 hypothetical protein GW571_13220 [Clavibacter capsici]